MEQAQRGLDARAVAGEPLDGHPREVRAEDDAVALAVDAVHAGARQLDPLLAQGKVPPPDGARDDGGEQARVPDPSRPEFLTQSNCTMAARKPQLMHA